VKALETPDLRERLAAIGVDPWPGTPEQLGELLRSEIETFGRVVRSANLPKQ
jgi:tripartite-type tricarboxylate transporter receptor subunit TctC